MHENTTSPLPALPWSALPAVEGLLITARRAAVLFARLLHKAEPPCRTDLAHLSTDAHPSGWPRSPDRALRCGVCSPSFCALLPVFKHRPPGIRGRLEDALRAGCPNRRLAGVWGPVRRYLKSQQPSAGGAMRCAGRVFWPLFDIRLAGDRGPSRFASAAGGIHAEDIPLTGNVFEALLAMGSQVDG
jgi:hypothetical protein